MSSSATRAIVRPRPTVNDVLDLYGKEYLPFQAATTRYQKSRVIPLIRASLGIIPLDELTPATLREWRDMLGGRLKPNSVRCYMSILSAALTAVVRDYEWAPLNPLRKVRKPPEAEERLRFLDEAEQARLFAACQRSTCKALYPVVLLAITTGARKTELLTLTWRDVDLERSHLQLHRRKHGQPQTVPFPERTREVLVEWKATTTSPLVFPSRSGVRPMDIRRAWYVALAWAQIENFHFHDLRHTAASYLAMSGVRIEDIAELLGHKSLATTRRYRHLTTAYTASFVEKMAQTFIKT